MTINEFGEETTVGDRRDASGSPDITGTIQKRVTLYHGGNTGSIEAAQHGLYLKVSLAVGGDNEIFRNSVVATTYFKGIGDQGNRIAISWEVKGTIIWIHDSARGRKPVPAQENILDQPANHPKILVIKSAIYSKSNVNNSKGEDFRAIDGRSPCFHRVVRAGKQVGTS